MAKDCPWQTKDFDLTKSKETVAQQFAVVNSIETMRASGSVERNAKGKNGHNPGGKQVKAVQQAEAKAKKLKRTSSLLDKPDDQLGLYEFIMCLVRIAFSHPNPNPNPNPNQVSSRSHAVLQLRLETTARFGEVPERRTG